MRILTQQASADLEEHGADRRGLVFLYVRNANGARVFSDAILPDALIGTTGQRNVLDGSFLLDGSVKLGEGSDDIIGVHGWLSSPGHISIGGGKSNNPLDVFREKELSSFSPQFMNDLDGDGHPMMSRLLAQEPFVGAKVDVRYGAAGQATGDVVSLASFTVRRIIETKEIVTFECEGA